MSFKGCGTLSIPKCPLQRPKEVKLKTTFEENVFIEIKLGPNVELQFHWHTLFSERKTSSKMLRFFWKRVYLLLLVVSYMSKICFFLRALWY